MYISRYVYLRCGSGMMPFFQIITSLKLSQKAIHSPVAMAVSFLAWKSEASTLITLLNRVFLKSTCVFWKMLWNHIKDIFQKKTCNNQFFVLRFDDNWPDSHLLGSFAYHLAWWAARAGLVLQETQWNRRSVVSWIRNVEDSAALWCLFLHSAPFLLKVCASAGLLHLIHFSHWLVGHAWDHACGGGNCGLGLLIDVAWLQNVWWGLVATCALKKIQMALVTSGS